MKIFFNKLERNRFPDGMVQLLVDPEINGDKHEIVASLRSFEDVLLLGQLVQILRTRNYCRIDLSLHYLIGSRMDRPNNTESANILRNVCDVINAMKFDTIRVTFPHSSSTNDLLDAFTHVRNELHFIQTGLFKIAEEWGFNWLTDEFDLCLPDAGAGKRYYNDHHSHLYKGSRKYRVVECGKHRDLATGKLSGFICPYQVNDTCVIIDDLCDGGGTFSGLAQKLRESGAKRVALIVYHGIMSKGQDLEGIDFVWTTNSFRDDLERTRTFRYEEIV